MLHRLLLCFVFAASGLHTEAQIDLDQAIPLQNTEVLETASIRKVLEGPYGFIWVAADAGLFRFDGSRLVSMYEGDFEDIDIDEFNNQLVFTGRELIVLYSFLGHDVRVIPKSEIVEGNFFLQTTIVLNDSVYVVGSNYGVSFIHLENGLVTSFQLSSLNDRKSEVTTGERDPRDPDILWLGTKAGMFSYDLRTGEFEHHWLKCTTAEHEVNLNVLDVVYIHPNGKIFWGSWGGGLAIYDPVSGEYEHVDNELNRLLNSHVYAIVPESDSIIWVSTTTGALRYNTETGTYESYLESEVIQDPVLDKGPVMIDRLGRFWIGYVHGLRVLDPNKSGIEVIECPLFTNEKFYITSTVSQGSDPKTVYLAVDFSDGLYSYNLESQEWHCIKSLGGEHGSEFRARDSYWEGDTMWILDHQGIYYFAEGTSRIVEIPLSLEDKPYRFRSFAKVDDDKLWVISSLSGLYEVRPSTGDIRHFSEVAELSDAHFLQKTQHIVVDRNGNVWCGLTNQLYFYVEHESRFIDVVPYLNNGESFLDIYSLTTNSTGLYMTTKKGAFQVQYLGQDRFSSRLLSNLPASTILPGAKEDIWMTTGQSITKLNSTTGALRQFTTNEGLPKAGRDGYERIDTLADGRMFLSGRRQFGLFYTETLEPVRRPPVPYFARVYIDGIEVSLSSLGLSLSFLRLEPNQNSITFDFSAISYFSQINNRFRYKLEGLNEEWIESGMSSRGPTYTNLPGGNYRFLVEAAGDDENWGAPAIIELTIDEYIWKKAWFHVLLAALGLGLILVIYLLRVKAIRRKGEIQLQIADLEKQALQAQMNPHFIFNAMNSIQNLIAKGDEKGAMFYLGRFGRLLRSVLDDSSQSLVTLSKELDLLENYILLESLRFRDKFEFDIEVDPGLENTDIRVPGFIIQPVVENAIQHGLLPKNGDGQLHITIKDNDAYLTCTVEDNGVGRQAVKELDKNNGSGSVGLKILEARLALYNRSGTESDLIAIEDLRREDGSPSGTRVNIKLPIQTLDHVAYRNSR